MSAASVLDQLAPYSNHVLLSSPLIQSCLEKAVFFTEVYSFSPDNYGHPHALLFWLLSANKDVYRSHLSFLLAWILRWRWVLYHRCLYSSYISRRPALYCLPCGGNDLRWLNYTAVFYWKLFLITLIMHVSCNLPQIQQIHFLYWTEIKVQKEKQMQEFSRM